LLTTAKVGLAPCSAFGAMGEGWLGMCFARDPEIVAEAVGRLRAVLD
jgi:aspartate/methionine/tyrosine aminotransferase